MVGVEIPTYEDVCYFGHGEELSEVELKPLASVYIVYM